MSEINANIVVSPYDVNITLESPTVEVVAEPINLLLSLGGFSGAGGNVTELQYNQAGGVLGGIPFANYANGNLTLGNVANVKILGGTNQYFLQTDGTGNLTWQAGTGNATGNGTVGGANTQIQFNDSANFGGAAGFTFDKVSNAFNSPGDGTFVGNVTANNFIGNFLGNTSQLVNGNSNVVVAANGNITISSNGVSNVVVITDDTIIGNIIEVNEIVLNNAAISLGNNAGTGLAAIVIGNNAAPNGLNTAAIAIGSGAGGNGFIQIASIAIGSGALNEGSGAFNIAIGSDAGRNTPAEDTVAIGINSGWGAGNNAVAIGTRAGAAANGANQPSNSLILNATGSNLQANASNTFYVKPIRSANTGNVLFYDSNTGEITFNTFTGNANVANTVSNNAQPNITSVGTLTSLAVTGNISGGNANLGNRIIGNFVTGTLTTNAQPNITSVGTLTSLAVTGNITGGNANLGNRIIGNFVTGTLTTNAQPNITSVGTLSSLVVTGNITGGNANLGNAVRGNYFIGDGGLLSNIIATSGQQIDNGNSNVKVLANSNITFGINGIANTQVFSENGANLGNAVSANYFIGNFYGTANSAATASTVTSATQSNITAVGTLTSLGVSGNITAANITANTGVFSGNGNNLTSLRAANLVGNTLSSNVTISSLTTVGNLSNLTVVGNIIANGNITSGNGIFVGNGSGLTNLNGANISGSTANANYANYAGDVVNSSQPNITSLGNLTSINFANTWSITQNSDGISLNSTKLYVNAEIFSNVTIGNNLLTPYTSGLKDVYIFGNFYTIDYSPNTSSDQSLISSLGTGARIATFGNSTTQIESAQTVTITSPATNIIGNFTFNPLANTSHTANFVGRLQIPQTSNVSTTVPTAANGAIVWSNADPKTIRVYGTSIEHPSGGWNNVVLENKTVVANLPNANIGSGFRAFVTDGNTTTFNAIVGGSGSNNVPVFSDGTNWRVG